MTYTTFIVLIALGQGFRHIEIPAISMEAAHADIRDAYGADVDIICTSFL